MNYYTTSDGERLTQRQINSKLAEAKKWSMQNFICECYGPPWYANDCDHTISQKRCKELHKTELIWDYKNWSWSCRKAHEEWESYKSGAFQTHKNVFERMSFIHKHDPEGFMKRLLCITDKELLNKLKQL